MPLGDSLLVFTITLTLTPLRDSILPPLSSRVVKQVLLRAGGGLGGLAGSRGSYKPLFISMLYRGDKPLYSPTGRRAGLLVVERGEVLSARIGVVAGKWVVEEVSGLNGSWSTSYGDFRVEVKSIRAIPPGSLSLPKPGGGSTGVLRIVARTPVILTTKVLFSGPPEYASRVPGGLHRLMPSPGIISAYALRMWNSIVGGERLVYFRDGWNIDAGMVSRVAEIYMAELDYHVVPETVVVGGGGRRARGWRGWVVYRVASPRLAKLLDQLLGLAAVLGLGRSRGLGLGDVAAEWVPARKRS